MNALFCCSLRKRPELASVPDMLLRSDTTPKWRESRLETHDLAVPLVKTNAGAQQSFRFIIVTGAGMSQLDTEKRLDRLYHLDGGVNAAVLFLVKDNGNESSRGTRSLIEFQGSTMEHFDMPILPFTSVDCLPATVTAFCKELHGRAARQPQSAFRRGPGPAQLLLPYCSVNPPLPERQVHILSDITDGVRDLASKAITSDGQRLLREWLDEPHAEDVISFWLHEHSVV